MVERYHTSLSEAFNCIRQDIGPEVSEVECLHLALFSVIATVGPEGHCPMLLVFGKLPRPARATPSPSQINQLITIQKEIEFVGKVQAPRRIKFGLRNSHGPKGIYISRELENFPVGSKGLVFRTGPVDG